MREILFRGKRVDNGEWVYGSLFISDTDNGYHILCGSTRSDYDYEVSKDTVGQYTGLKDKKGNKIFEGDIVEFDRPKGAWGCIAEIIFESAEFRYHPITDADMVWNCRLFYEEKTLTVIGDIHDNPELILLCQSSSAHPKSRKRFLFRRQRT